MLKVAPGSKSLLEAVLKSSARRRLTVSMLGILAIGILPAVAAPSHTHLSTVPVASGPWLDRFNAWRASVGVSVLSEDATFSAGDLLHATYMVQTGDVAHSENPAFTQYYTAAGNTAAQNSNIYVSSSTNTQDTQAIDWWMGAPFHSMAMMDPRLTTTGFGSYRNGASPSSWQMGAAVNVAQGMTTVAPGAYPVYFPGNGSTEPLTMYSGNEFPNPQQACPNYWGLPLFVEVGPNVNTAASSVTLLANGAPVANPCVIDSTNATFASYLKWRGGVIVFPPSPLQNGVTYSVALTVNNAPYAWSFTVGAGPVAAPPPPPPFKALYTLDGWGNVHGADSPALSVSAYWPGWKIARTAKPWPSTNSPQSGFVLDGWGGLHPYGIAGLAETSSPVGHYWPGWDIARDFAFLPNGTGGVVLDGWGGLHAFHVNGSTALISIQATAYWPYWDIARKVVVFADGSGGYVMDGWGGLHPFGINGAAPILESSLATTGYWVNWDIARDVVLVPGNGGHSGYTLDGWGGLHQFHPTSDGSTMPAAIPAPGYWPYWDIARGVWLVTGSATKGYTLDGWGGLHPFGGAPAIKSAAYWPWWDIAVGVFGA